MIKQLINSIADVEDRTRTQWPLQNGHHGLGHTCPAFQPGITQHKVKVP